MFRRKRKCVCFTPAELEALLQALDDAYNEVPPVVRDLAVYFAALDKLADARK